MRQYIVIGFLLCVSTPINAELRVVVLDVDEGQAVLLQQGSEGILVDLGHLGAAPHILQRLTHYGVRSLEYIVITHLHPDHASGYFRVREAFPEAVVLDHHQPIAGQQTDTVRWVAEALIKDQVRLRVMAGDAKIWRDAKLEFLWPPGFSGNNLNRNSLVVRLTYGQTRVLIMGDAGHEAEAYLLKSDIVDEVDLYVAGHHGAADSNSEAFIKRLAPGLSVISVNRDNIRGYPDASVVERLEKYSGDVALTAVSGDICRMWPSKQRPMQYCK